MAYRDFHQPVAAEAAYQAHLAKLLAWLRKAPAGATIGELLERAGPNSRGAKALDGLAEVAARRMVTGQLAQSARGWRAAAAKGSRGAEIHAMLQRELQGPVGAVARRLVREQAKLIRGVPGQVRERAVAFIATEQRRGRRAEDIAKDLRRRFPGMTDARIRGIARTQVGKADSALTQARATSIGIDFYVWETSQDARVRPSHRKMQGVLVPFAEPPAPEALIGEKSTLGHYHAGDCPYCRCLEVPLTDLGEVQWPARVYSGGRIVRMARVAFERKYLLAVAAAA